MELSNEAMVQSSLIQVYCPNLLSLQGSISAPSSSHFQHDDDQCKQFEDKSEHFPSTTTEPYIPSLRLTFNSLQCLRVDNFRAKSIFRLQNEVTFNHPIIYPELFSYLFQMLVCSCFAHKMFHSNQQRSVSIWSDDSRKLRI